MDRREQIQDPPSHAKNRWFLLEKIPNQFIDISWKKTSTIDYRGIPGKKNCLGMNMKSMELNPSRISQDFSPCFIPNHIDFKWFPGIPWNPSIFLTIFTIFSSVSTLTCHDLGWHHDLPQSQSLAWKVLRPSGSNRPPMPHLRCPETWNIGIRNHGFYH